MKSNTPNTQQETTALKHHSKKRKIEQCPQLVVEPLSLHSKNKNRAMPIHKNNNGKHRLFSINAQEQDKVHLRTAPTSSPIPNTEQLIEHLTTCTDLSSKSDMGMAPLNHEPQYPDTTIDACYTHLSTLEKLSAFTSSHHNHMQQLTHSLTFNMLSYGLFHSKQAVLASQPQNTSIHDYVPGLEEIPIIQGTDLLSSIPLDLFDQLSDLDFETVKTAQAMPPIASSEQAAHDCFAIHSFIPEQNTPDDINQKRSGKKVSFAPDTHLSNKTQLNFMLNTLKQDQAELNFYLNHSDLTDTTDVDQLMKRIAIRMSFPSSKNEYTIPLNMNSESPDDPSFVHSHILNEMDLLRKENSKLMYDLFLRLKLRASSALSHTAHKEEYLPPIDNNTDTLEESPVIASTAWENLDLSSLFFDSPNDENLINEEQKAAKSTPKKPTLNNPLNCFDEDLFTAKTMSAPTPLPIFFSDLTLETSDEPDMTPNFFNHNA